MFGSRWYQPIVGADAQRDALEVEKKFEIVIEIIAKKNNILLIHILFYTEKLKLSFKCRRLFLKKIISVLHSEFYLLYYYYNKTISDNRCY